MMDDTVGTVSMWSYGLAAAGFFAFVIRLAMGFRATARGLLMVGAVLASGLWALTGALVTSWPSAATWAGYVALDAVRYAMWFAFLWSVLRGGEENASADVPRPLPMWFGAL